MDIIQNARMWASELPEVGSLFLHNSDGCIGVGVCGGCRWFIFWLLLVAAILSHVCHCCIPPVSGMVWMGVKRPPLLIVWCDGFMGNSPLYWSVFLQINVKMNFHRIMLFRWINDFPEYLAWFKQF